MRAPDLKQLSEQMRTRGCAFHHNGGDAPTLFQVTGERASGTNVVRKSIEQNLGIERTDGLGWKHGFPAMAVIPKNVLVVSLFRNAVDWSLSMHKRPWHAHPFLQSLPYSEFIRAEWHSVVDRVSDFSQIPRKLRPYARGEALQFDRHPITGEPFANIFVLRHAKLVSTLGIRNRGCHFAWIRLEAFQKDPQLILNRLRTAFDLSPRDAEYVGVERRMGTRFTAALKKRPETPDSISAADREFMRSQLDLKLESLLGYSY